MQFMKDKQMIQWYKLNWYLVQCNNKFHYFFPCCLKVIVVLSRYGWLLSFNKGANENKITDSKIILGTSIWSVIV